MYSNGKSFCSLFFVMLMALTAMGCGKPHNKTITVNEEISLVASSTGTRNFVPNDQYYGYISSEYLAGEHHMDVAWRYATGRGVIIAIIDAGQSPHEDMKDAYAEGGYDFIYEDNNVFIGEREVREAEAFGDVMDHGTACASAAAARGGNKVGMVGTAPDSKILPFVTYTQDGRSSSLLTCQAIDLARLRGAKVISMSFGGPGVHTALAEATYRAAQAGIILVASAGNKNTRLDTKDTTSGSYPGSFPWVINVGATRVVYATDLTETYLTRASFSNFGTGVDVFWRGTDVLLALGFVNSFDGLTFDSYYTYGDGTSFSAPQVAGLIACALELRPDLNATTIRALLQASADNLPGQGQVLVNAGRFMQSVAALPPDGIMTEVLPPLPGTGQIPGIPSAPIVTSAAAMKAEEEMLFSAQARAERQQSLHDPNQQVLAEWSKPRLVRR